MAPRSRPLWVDGGEIGRAQREINAPGVPLPASAITPKDVDDWRSGSRSASTWWRSVFVQSAADLYQARELMAAANARGVPLIAKLETAEGDRAPGRDSAWRAIGDGRARRPRARDAARERARAQKDITRAARPPRHSGDCRHQVLESMTKEGPPHAPPK